MKGSTSSDVFDLVGNTALYEVLGLTPDASERDIRRAYYRIAIVYHPDKNPDGEEIFKEGRAKEYDPEMDPTVELTPDDLRRFVDKLKSTSDRKKKKLSDFELRREEEMKRRAEYDAKQPGFKAEYERQRELRKQRAAHMLDSRQGESLALTTGLRFRTCAEMTEALDEEETRRRRGERISSPNRHSTKLVNMKEDLLRQYRTGEIRGGGGESRRNEDFGTKGSGMDKALTMPRGKPEFVRKHEEQAGSAYSATVDETLKKYRNYDYLDAVVKDKEDKLEMDGAILADALSLYDNKN